GQSSATGNTTTDSAGAYLIADLPPGQYLVTAIHQDYPFTNRPAPKQIEVKAGERTSQSIELTPGASISGKVLDEDGDPLPGCFVQLHPAAHPQQGAPSLGGSPGAEEGEYRLYGIPAGRYIANAQCSTPVFQPRPFSAGPDPPPSLAYPLQFYPTAPDAKSADVIELTAANEKTGVDFRMKPAPVTQIHGTFSPAGADWRGIGPLAVQLIPADLTAPRQVSGASLDVAKGTFTFPRVFPGSYIVTANSADQQHHIGASQRVEVKNDPVDVSLELKPAIQLTGKVEVDGDARLVNLPAMIIQFQPVEFQVHSPGQAKPNEDGSFTSSPLVPGQWKILLQAGSAYLKSAWLGSEEVTNRPLDLSSGSPGPLRIVLGTNWASIEGNGPPGYSVVAQNLESGAAFWASRDPSGRFKLGNLPPGKYRLVATFDPGPLPEGGQEITVHEGESATLDVKPRP
ncbi:MAG: carboxypeptidase-like regulatory domain-containing protein, partial [Acidobacteriia bacterium]|nr:carboxypeptidase-like regulatory domain-containing protein [Terriglobia bacterium]